MDRSQHNPLLTDDDGIEPAPTKNPSQPQPMSAIQEKVQQFEEMATLVTRTKTGAIPKKVLTSANKPGIIPAKSVIPSSTSNLSSINTAREVRSPRSKKKVLLEAKRELQKKKREEKMAAAAAARSAAERERNALLEAAEERREKQARANLGKLKRLREAERKKHELARKVPVTEERRKAEEQARKQRLADERKRAEAARKKHLEEAEAMKKEEALMAKEIERRQKRFMELPQMRQGMDGDDFLTPLKNIPAPEPVYMKDGFQYLVSDEDKESPEQPIPAWSTHKARRSQLDMQARVSPRLLEQLFDLRRRAPDLRDIFPGTKRPRPKRSSSAVGRTSPRRPPERD